jgi:predicted tellurium resistance membrane protein TerC
MFEGSIWLWIGFNVFVLALLALDLGVFHQKAHKVSIREATIWSIVWITLSLLFNLGLYFFWKDIAPASNYSNKEAALAFLTGYVLEKSLSVDNIFIFVVIFSFFAVPAAYQHRVLFWGILGALIMRGILIVAGAALLKEFHWIIYLFGAFLIFTGIRMAIQRKGKLTATPLFLVLLIVESTDLLFAVDSIPAIFAVTEDPFIVYTSNVFAILGLRSLYFLLAGVVDKFYYLKLGLSAVLVFVGTKMVITDFYKIPIGASLAVIAGILTISIVASLRRARSISNLEETTM